MNRIRGIDGGGTRASGGQPADRRAGSEVVYVGRASFWTAHDSELFQEMPESPWPAMEVPAGGEGSLAESRDADGGAAALSGLSFSGPIVLQSASDYLARRADSTGHEDASRKKDSTRPDDSNGTPMLAGEVHSGRTARLSRGASRLSLAPLLAVTFAAFSIGLLVSPSSDAPVLRRGVGGAAWRAPSGGGVSSTSRPSGPARDARSKSSIPAVVPMPQAAAFRPEPSATVGRATPFGSKVSHGGLKLAASKHGRVHDRALTRQAAAATPSGIADTGDEGDAAGDFDVDLTSRKSAAKESIDATKQGAPSVDAERKPTRQAWVDPWAN